MDDLDEEDVALLARARFSIGVGLESGSPTMLTRMNKAANPQQYLERIERFAGLALKHGLNWSANVIVGHPGETPETLSESAAFCRRLFTAQAKTTGWLSVNPFRLYPGSQVWEESRGQVPNPPNASPARNSEHSEPGPTYHHPDWWRTWSDQGFHAEHVDPSPGFDYSQRVRAMYDAFGPLIREIPGRFRGQGTAVDEVFRRSQQEQVEMLSPEVRDRLLERAGRRSASKVDGLAPQPRMPVGLQVRDEAIRQREQTIAQMIDAGTLCSEPVIEALLDSDSRALPLPLFAYALALEAMDPKPGESAASVLGSERYMAELLKILVDPGGAVRTKLGREPLDLLWLGEALPRFPNDCAQLLKEGGRCVTILGPRFRKQDLVCLTKVGGQLRERVLAKVVAPSHVGRWGWTSRVWHRSTY
ncbi:MAG: radical SAM protein [Myxococcales bacterium]